MVYERPLVRPWARRVVDTDLYADRQEALPKAALLGNITTTLSKYRSIVVYWTHMTWLPRGITQALACHSNHQGVHQHVSFGLRYKYPRHLHMLCLSDWDLVQRETSAMCTEEVLQSQDTHLIDRFVIAQEPSGAHQDVCNKVS